MNGTLCVQTFYVVSGFLIQYILPSYLCQSNGLRKFYCARALRIYPLYWLVAATWAIWFGNPIFSEVWKQGQVIPIITGSISNVFLFGQDALRFFFYDTATHRMWLISPGIQTMDGLLGGSLHLANFVNTLGQSWSLALELSFYLVAPWVLRFRTRWLLAVCGASILIRGVMISSGYNGQSWINAFFPQELGTFIAGSISCRLYRRYIEPGYWQQRMRLRLPWLPRSAPGVIALGVVIYWEVFGRELLPPGEITWGPIRWYQHHQSLPLGWWITLLVTVVALPILFDYSRNSKIDTWIGELSYPIYLNHLLVMVAMLQHGLTTNYITMPLAATVLAIPMLMCVDRPLEKLRHRYLRISSSTAERDSTHGN
jgi:peptidoglycan/LPS O-acetylase OafA/YrhL